MLQQLTYKEGKLTLLRYNALELLNSFTRQDYSGYSLYRVPPCEIDLNEPHIYMLLHDQEHARDFIIAIYPVVYIVDGKEQYNYSQGVDDLINECGEYMPHFRLLVDKLDNN